VDGREVRLPAGTGFDPGGIGKGLAADMVVAETMAAGAAGVCVNLGGDLRVTGLDPTDAAWTVAVEYPLAARPLAYVGLRDGAGVLWGLVLSTKLLGKRPRANWVLDLHRFLGGAAVVFTGIHVASIVLDSYVHFGLVDVLVPLASSSHPVAVAWGIVALYLV